MRAGFSASAGRMFGSVCSETSWMRAWGMMSLFGEPRWTPSRCIEVDAGGILASDGSDQSGKGVKTADADGLKPVSENGLIAALGGGTPRALERTRTVEVGGGTKAGRVTEVGEGAKNLFESDAAAG